MKKTILLAAAVAASLAFGYDLHTPALTPITEKARPAGESMTFVKGGELRFAIVVDKQAEAKTGKWNRSQKSVEPAVSYLIEAFERTTGRKPEILDVSEREKIAACPFVLAVGATPFAAENGVDGAKLPLDGFAVKTFARGVILAGRDTSTVEGWNMQPLESRGSSCGTKYAALDFAERFLGVRYYAPGEYGTYWPKIVDFTVAPVWYEDAPSFRIRGDTWYPACALQTEELIAKWTRALGSGFRKGDVSFVDRWRNGNSLGGPTGMHNPDPQKMMKAHPDRLKEIFYTSPYGKFWMNPGGHTGNAWNILNLGFADLMLEDLKKVYATDGREDPGGYRGQLSRDAFGFGICDTYLPATDFIDHPLVKELGLISQADIDRDPDGALANVNGRFFHYLANRTKETFPDKKLVLLCYYNCKCAPTDPRWKKLPDNVEINLCDFRLPRRTRSEKAMTKTRTLFREWYEALGDRPILRAWLYTSDSNPFVRAVTPEFTAEVPRVLGKYLGEAGVFFDVTGAHDMWNYYWALYVSYRAQWNYNLDVDAAIDEHWNLFYGPVAGPHLKEFHRLLKRAYLDYALESEEETPLYPIEIIDALERELKAANAALDPESPEGHRIRLLTEYWPSAFSMMRTRAAYRRPVYAVKRLPADADDAFWAGVEPMPLFDPWGRKQTVDFPAAFKLAWTDEGLVGRFVADSYAPLACDPAKRDIWGVDSCEMFFSPGQGREVVYQLVFDSFGRTYSQMQRWVPIPQPVDGSWRPDFKPSVTCGDNGWRCDFRVPFSFFGGFAAPKAGERWDFNVVRNKLAKPKEVTGSSLTLGSHHNRIMYGSLEFVK